MEYTPRYSQPFTLEQAILLDVPIITEEISRLENSLEHLKRTQEQLREAVTEDPDPEFATAIQENQLVIGSQEERIRILKVALTEKGIPTSSHYDARNFEQAPPSAPGHNGPPESTGIGLATEDVVDDGGIDL